MRWLSSFQWIRSQLFYQFKILIMRRKTFCWFRSETGLKGFDAKPSIGTLKGLVLQFSFNLCCHHLFLSLSLSPSLSLSHTHTLSLFSLSNLCCNPFSQKNCCKKKVFNSFSNFVAFFNFVENAAALVDKTSIQSRRKVDEKTTKSWQKVDEKSTKSW